MNVMKHPGLVNSVIVYPLEVEIVINANKLEQFGEPMTVISQSNLERS